MEYRTSIKTASPYVFSYVSSIKNEETRIEAMERQDIENNKSLTKSWNEETKN